MGGQAQSSILRASTHPLRGPNPQRDLYKDIPDGRTESESKLQHAGTIRIGAVNICSLLKPALHRQIEDYMSSRDIGVLALGETRSSNTSKYLVGETTFITSSDPPIGREYAGVG
eukprot:15469518-Alexandrium_andersonii.AAC.1